ncbi:MAG TPA: DUF935 family protein, partial [Polyangiaceae bacterium]|nr:DUF935 family protein [Polyangiaceae bacterium]
MSFLSALARPFTRSFWRPSRPAERAAEVVSPAALALPPGPPAGPAPGALASPQRAELATTRRRREGDAVLVAHQPIRVPVWEVEQVQAALALHEQGDFSYSGALAEAMRRCPAIEPALKKRVDALFGLRFSFDPSDDAPPKRGKTIAAAADKAWTYAHPEPVLKRLHRLSLMVGVVPVQVLSDRAWSYRLDVWDPQWLRFNWSSRAYEVMTSQGTVEATTPRWRVYAPEGVEGWSAGLIRPLALVWLIHTFAMRDWARWSERHGLPILGVKYPMTGWDEEARARFVAEIYAMGRQAVIGLPQLEDGLGAALELIEARDLGFEGFERLMGVCRLMAQIALLGGNLTSEVKGGSYAAATVHSDEFRALLKSDGQSLSTFLREACWEPWAEAHYGDARLAPWGCWDTDPPADLKAEGESYKALGEGITALEANGLEVDAPALAERFNIPLKAPAEGGDAGGAGIKARQVYEYHLKYGLLTVDEGRA